MGIISWLKSKFSKDKRGYYFTDDDRLKSARNRQLNQQLKDMEFEQKLALKHIDLKKANVELRKLQAELDSYEEEEIEEEYDEDHDSWTSIFKGLLKNPDIQTALLNRLGSGFKKQDTNFNWNVSYDNIPPIQSIVDKDTPQTLSKSSIPFSTTESPLKTKDLMQTFANWAEDNQIPAGALLDLKKRFKL